VHLWCSVRRAYVSENCIWLKPLLPDTEGTVTDVFKIHDYDTCTNILQIVRHVD
jgi:hypothetical protein